MMHKILPFLLLIITAFSNSGKSQCVYVTQPGPTDGIDAVCHRYPLCGLTAIPCDTSNRSTSKHIYASSKQLTGVNRIMRSFVKFDLSQFGKIDATALPTSAILNLYYYRDALAGDEHLNIGSNAFYIERIVTDWKDDTIRWQTPVSSGNLRMPEVTIYPGAKNRILVPATKTATEDVTVDMTAMVAFWMENPDSNFGFRIKLVDETTERQVHFCSSDYDVAQFRPKMTIDFPKVIANAGDDGLVCEGSGIKLNASGGAVYKWTSLTSGADILSKYDIPNPLLKATKAQSFEVEVSIGSCTSKDQVFIDFGIPRPARISIPAKDTFLCLGDSLQLEATGGTFFKWSPSEILSNDELTSPWCKPTENVRIYVSTISAGDKCPGIDSVDIDIKKQTIGKVSFNDTTLCKGDSVQMFASGGILYEWTPKDSVNSHEISSPIAFVRGTTQFIVKIEDVNACPDYDTVVIKIVESITIDAGPDLTICNGDTVELNANGNGTFFWNNSESLSDPFIANPKAFPAVTTTYTLTVQGVGCSGIDDLTITVNEKPTITTDATELTVCTGEEVTLAAQGTTNYWWSTGESSDKIIVKIDEPNKKEVFKVVGNDGQCPSDTIYITLTSQRCGAPYVILPKFFSPNGDGINDYFVIKDIKRYENEVIVINKWGDIVFRRTDYDNKWDGTYNGQNVAEDTYLYVVRVKVEGEWQEERGTVSILRTRN